jgi:hypothetical protein
MLLRQLGRLLRCFRGGKGEGEGWVAVSYFTHLMELIGARGCGGLGCACVHLAPSTE